MSVKDLTLRALTEGPTLADLDQLSKYSLVEICKSMKNYLCDPSSALKAVEIIISVSVHSQRLNVELFFLVQFICNICGESPVTCAMLLSPIAGKATIKGIACAPEVFDLMYVKCICKINIRRCALAERQGVFSVLEFLISEENIRRFDSSQIQHIFELMDDERSPELVIRFFRCAEKIAEYAPPAQFAPVSNACFESVSSYFPIVFAQPPNSNISKKDLQQKLREVMSLTAFIDTSLPFLFGKIASPSISVKREVLETLLSCLRCNKQLNAIQLREIASVCLREALLIARAQNEVSEFVRQCGAVLGSVSSLCESKSTDTRISIFGFLMEEKVIAQENFTIVQLYATFFFYVLSGSWATCMDLSTFFISSILCKDDPQCRLNSLIFLCAIFTSVVDLIVTLKPELQTYQNGLERIKPSLIEWTNIISKSLKDDENHLSVVCKAEFLTSLLQFQFHLGRWLGTELTTDVLVDLLSMAAVAPKEVFEKTSKLLKNYGRTDWESVEGALKRINFALHESSVLLELGSCCSRAVSFAVDTIISSQGESDALQVTVQILSACEELYMGDAKHIFIKLIEGNEKRKHWIYAMGMLCIKAPDCFFAELSQQVRSLSLPEAAIILCCANSLDVPSDYVDHLHNTFSSLLSVPESRDIALNGLIGCFNFSETLAEAQILINTHVLIAVGLLWSYSLCNRKQKQDHLEKCFLVVFNSERSDVEEAFAFEPVLPRLLSKPISLLPCLIECSLFIFLNSSFSFLMEALLACLAKERAEIVCTYASAIVNLLDQGTKKCNHVDNSRSIFTVLKILHNSGAREWEHVLFANSLLSLTVFGGLKLPNLLDRCIALSILKDAADSVTESSTSAKEFRMKVLSSSLESLSDPKRRVRLAAARCRHAWFLSK